jgi:hypothetical protein
VGLDAAFAKAIARAEFGQFYVDEQQQREVRRSLDRAKGHRKPEQEAESQEQTPPPAPRSKSALWHPPKVRERRTELAEARSRIAAAAKLRQAKEDTEV